MQKAVGRGKYEQKRKRVSYRAVLNICPVILERSDGK